MARHKDRNWNLPEITPAADGSRTHSWESIQTAVLMDIREELKMLNRLLHCSHFVDIPRRLERIARNTAKPKRKRKGPKNG